jgi:hypothetical protein
MMPGIGSQPCNPELRELVVEAALALARLDAERLEELALSCRDLYRELIQAGNAASAEWARQAREACSEMAVFGRVLDATRSNLDVMKRLRDNHFARLEYGPWALAETCDGNH